MGNALGISKREIGNLLLDIKINLLNHVGSKLTLCILARNKRKLKKIWQYIGQHFERFMD